MEGSCLFDKVVLHEDFEVMLELLARIKIMQQANQVSFRPQGPKSRDPFPPSEIAALAEKVTKVQKYYQNRQQQRDPNGNILQPIRILRRGEDPVADLLTQDFIRSLERELEYQQEIERVQQPNESIAVKYPKWQTDILNRWMIENIHDPFPDDEQIQQLMHETQLSHSQIVNWTTNCRKRSRKATLNGGKKAHSFIDYMFIAAANEAENDSDPHSNMELNRMAGVHSHMTCTPVRKNSLARPASPTSQMSAWQKTSSSSATLYPSSGDINGNHASVSSSSLGPVTVSPTRSECAAIVEHGASDKEDAEPLSVHAPVDESLMLDFASSWLSLGSFDMDEALDESPPPRHSPPYLKSSTSPDLLPKVSEDSDETDGEGKRKREDSFDMVVGSIDSCLAEWAAENGLDLSTSTIS